MVLPASPLFVCALIPPALMLASSLLSSFAGRDEDILWKRFKGLAAAAALAAFASLLLACLQPQAAAAGGPGWLAVSLPGAWAALLVQMLGTTIAVFSSRYLQGEPGQARYAAALAGVLAAVHVLLLADHWAVLIAAWAAAGVVLQRLLCFYGDRPFALLAAHKKRIADRLADLLLLAAAALAWRETGSLALSDLWQHLANQGGTLALHASAVCLVLAVILRTALFPVHGWLIQVMEAPTPVSALLHAGVVNLGGYVLVRFAPLLEQAPAARWLVAGVGLGTAMLAGLVMLTRVSIKVRLAWSTVAQMGFMLLECGLGLYTLAMLHLLGHSLYKAHAFLSSSNAVNDTRARMMRPVTRHSRPSLAAAPLLALLVVMLSQAVLAPASWPWWWSGVLALAWAPLLWLPILQGRDMKEAAGSVVSGLVSGLGMVMGLAALAGIAHRLPLGLADMPDRPAGIVSLLGMAAMYLCLVRLQVQPQGLAGWRRWSYAGFYVDEFATRMALRLWPARWVPAAPAARGAGMSGAMVAAASE
ncbi:NADH-quinone oxidoreductase subunit L [Noviherbaspirillum galbum]|uniref:Probable inorganic carbon transporter subunit DabB n=1 Tax=Noviherbaspirillum galbum TaxID=2709383 RepID=A0A6B3SUS0_9BURK|nr:NADH-quinone oxidoreductase subunit L [Noviherbaspirillum galbum]NEX62112.1 NADH-quinone oxidoreductase subunit L [Noviherbaspirillum galbum]